MQDTSSLYKSIMAGIHRFEVKLDIAGTEYGMSELVALKTNVAAFSDDGPQLGLAVAQEISVDVYADSADIPRMAELKPYYRVINDRRQSEWIQKGVFYLDTRERSSSGVMHLTGFDNMLKAEVVYPGSSLSWPATDIDVVREIAGFMNVTIDARTTAIMTSGYEVQLAPQMTMREMLQYIAAMYGGSFIFSDTGALLLVCVWNLDDSAPYTIAQKGISQSTRPAFPPCTGVRFIVSQSATEQTEIFSGDETGYVYEIECPFATQEIADSLLGKMQGMVYRPYSAEKVAADPALEIGDAVTLGEETKTGSQNLVIYPLGSDRTRSGFTYSYETDGSVSLSGASTAPTGYDNGSVLTQFQLPKNIRQITVIVETSDDFPSRTESGQSVSFCAWAHRDGTTAMQAIQLNDITVGSGKKRFCGTLTSTTDITDLEIDFYYNTPSDSESRTYNDNIRIMVVQGNEAVMWEAPNGAQTEIVSGIYSFGMNFNSACRPTIAAPGELEIDHEYTMDKLSARSFKRMKREVYSEISLLDDRINLKVSKGDVSAQISLEPEDITISGNRIQITSTNWSITKDGVMTAKSGSIGGWDILPSKLEKKEHNSGITLDPTNKYFDMHSSTNGVHIDEDEVRWYHAANGEEDYDIAKMAARLISGGELADLEMTMYNQCGFYIKDDGGTQYISVSSEYKTVTINQECAFSGDIFQSAHQTARLWDVEVNGSLDTRGSKNRVIDTKHYGMRRLGAYETAAPYFGDIGQGTTDKNGECIVPIEAIFSETVDLDTEYQVFLQKEGPGDIWVQEKAKDHFTVKGTPGLKFAWELKAKQIDHGGKRLEEYKPKEEPEAHE